MLATNPLEKTNNLDMSNAITELNGFAPNLKLFS